MSGVFGLDVKTPRGQETLVGAAIACLAGVGAVVSGGSPTGLAVWDAVLKFGLAAVVVLAASKAPRWAAVVVASVAAAVAGLTVWLVVAWVALVLALASTLMPRRSRPIGAVSAALTIQVLMRLPAFGFFGLASFIAAVCFLLILISGYGYATRTTRRRARRVAGALTVVTVVFGLVGGISLLSARSDVERGIQAAQRGLEAARGGDAAVVAAELQRAEQALRKADQRAGSPAVQPLRLIPIVAQHQRAIRVTTQEGAAIASEASSVAQQADLETLTLSAGSVDLAAMKAMAPQLRSTASALESGLNRIGDARSGWLLPAVETRIDNLIVEIEELLPEARLAADAVEIVPDLLGASGERSYFVIFGTPAEAREGGGLLGSWALVSAADGALSVRDSGRIEQLYPIAAGNEIPAGVVSDWYLEMARPSRYPQNLTSSPDFLNVAEAAQSILSGAFEAPVDGFVYLDAWVLVDLMRLTGPVAIPFQDDPLTPDNAADFFFDGQYRVANVDRSELFDALSIVASSVLQSLATESTLPGPEALGRLLGPAARAGRLQVTTFDEAENAFLKSVKLLRSFEQSGTQDFVGIVQTNGTPSKLDLYLSRDVNYQVAVNSDGQLSGTVTVSMRSSVPPDAPPYTLGPERFDGVNRVLLSLYSPHSLIDARLDGLSVDSRSALEFGLGRYLVDSPVPPTAETVVVEYEVSGQLNPADPYSLEIWHQPLVNSDNVTVSYTGPDGSFEWQGELTENVVLRSDELVD